MEGIDASDLVFGIQASLIEQESVSVQVLINAKNFLQPKHYEAVYMERSLMERCGWPLCNKMKPTNKRSRYRIAQGSIYDDAGIEHFCSLECMKESKLYLSQLSDESIYHRKPTKEKPKAPEKPQVAPQQAINIIITENKNLNKDVDNFDTNNTTPTPTPKSTQTPTKTQPKTPIKNNHLVVERNNTSQSMNSKNDNNKNVARQNYNKKNILEKKKKMKKMNDDDENDEGNFEYKEDEEDFNEEDEENEALELDLHNSRETVVVELDSLSDFGKIWNLIMNWVTDDTIAYFSPKNECCEKRDRSDDTETGETKIPTVDGQTMDISRRKVFATFTSSYLNELSLRLQLPYAIHNAFYLCAATFNFKCVIPSLSKKLWSQIVLVIVFGISQKPEFIEDVFLKLEPMLPTLVNELSFDMYTVNLLSTLLRTGE